MLTLCLCTRMLPVDSRDRVVLVPIAQFTAEQLAEAKERARRSWVDSGGYCQNNCGGTGVVDYFSAVEWYEKVREQREQREREERERNETAAISEYVRDSVEPRARMLELE